MDLTQILEATLSPDSEAIRIATEQLENAAQTNLGAFLTALANELANVSKSQVARMAAGLQLKNYLTSKTPEVRLRYQQAWISFDPSIRQHIKDTVLSTLGTEAQQHRAASQCIAYIAAVELPNNSWPTLMPSLLTNITNPQATEDLKESSLEAIGYVCEEVDHKFLAHLSNEILTGIVQGMRKEEPSNRVRLAATKALLNSLEFTKANFEKEAERHFIMQVVCEATQCNCVPVQVAALQNLVKIMSLYYQYMEYYMGPALFAITLEAMKSAHDEIALQGIEFWSTVCDEEADLAIEAAEAGDLGRPPEQVSKFYVKGALQFLVPILLETLAKQEEFDDEDDWNPCKAAGVCLSLMAACCEDVIVPLVFPFVEAHLVDANWKYRDAAVMAVGSILEGPDPAILQQYLPKIINALLDLMSDSMVQVSDSAAWTVGRVCEHSPSSVLNDQYLLKLLQQLTAGLSGEPRVATNVCWAFSSLAEAAYEAAVETAGLDEPPTSCLSTSFEAIITKLLETTDRPDSGMGNLRSSAYEALMDMIKYSAKDCYPVVQNTTLVVVQRLTRVLQIDAQSQGIERQPLADLESLLCATLQSLLRKLTPADALSLSDTVMQTLLAMLQNSSGKTGGVQEDAIMTVGVLVEAIELEFLRYMEVFKPFLLIALGNFADHQVCQAAVGLVGDLCRSLKNKIQPYCTEIMTFFVQNLSNDQVHRSLKPQILSTIGDVGLAIGPGFKEYLQVVFKILSQVVQLSTQPNQDLTDYDQIDYMNDLREGCLEAYTGIIQGLKGDNEKTINPDVQLTWDQVPFMIQLIDFIAKDEDRTDGTISCSAGLLGDLCTAFSKRLLPLLANSQGPISKLLIEGRKSRNKQTKALSQWAYKELKQLQS